MGAIKKELERLEEDERLKAYSDRLKETFDDYEHGKACLFDIATAIADTQLIHNPQNLGDKRHGNTSHMS